MPERLKSLFTIEEETSIRKYAIGFSHEMRQGDTKLDPDEIDFMVERFKEYLIEFNK